MQTRPEVIVIGDANVDIILEVPGHPKSTDLSGSSGTVRGMNLHIGSGGAAANTAHALGKLGNRVAFVGVVSNDPFAVIIKKHLSEAGVDLSHLGEVKGKNTGMVFRFESPSGNVIYASPGPQVIPLEIIDLNYLSTARIVYYSGNFLTQSNTIGKMLLEIAMVSKNQGVVQVVDPGRYWLDMSLSHYVEELVRAADILLPNLYEAQLLTGLEDPTTASKRLLEYGAKWVVIKMGNKGCLAISKDSVFNLPSLPVETKSVFGAGDVFNSGIIHGFLKDWSFKDTVIFANTLAGLKVQYYGTQEGIPSELDVLKYIARA